MNISNKDMIMKCSTELIIPEISTKFKKNGYSSNEYIEVIYQKNANLWNNMLLLGDNKDIMIILLDHYREKIDLIYIDPPFFTESDYYKRIFLNKQFIQKISYNDKWNNNLDSYLTFLYERLMIMKDLLSNKGSIYIHLDWHVSHYIKIILDRILGYSNFINEIVWKRTNSPKAQSRGFGSQHDVILLYAKNRSEFKLRPVFREHDVKSLKPYSYKDEKGKFRLIEIEAQGIQRTEKRKQFEWRGRTAPYLYKRETLDSWWKDGLIYTSKNDRYSKKQYLSDVPGILASDIWTDISPIQGSSKEYSGFLTQKPLSLLHRIISSATDEADIVADFFAGSGTTAIAAATLSRNWIICDVSDVAIEVAEHRLSSLAKTKVQDNQDFKCEYEIINLTS